MTSVALPPTAYWERVTQLPVRGSGRLKSGAGAPMAMFIDSVRTILIMIRVMARLICCAVVRAGVSFDAHAAGGASEEVRKPSIRRQDTLQEEIGAAQKLWTDL
jgi:hypothetical protein